MITVALSTANSAEQANNDINAMNLFVIMIFLLVIIDIGVSIFNHFILRQFSFISIGKNSHL